jgi:uncharacterized phage protein gp47/JayE
MPNEITAAGLTIESLNDIVESLEDGLKEIYGNEINVDSNTPDGQWVNIIAQAKRDILEVVQQVYNSFDPDNAIGRVLDQRLTINNIKRQGGTYTLQQAQITVDRNLSLQGLDEDAENPDGTGFTISDNVGNQFILLDSADLTPGTATLTFRAKLNGAVSTTPNTIINAVTIILGVTGINNSSGVLELGRNEESDPQARLRRARSVANGSAGYLNGLLGVVLDIDGVTDAQIYENYSNVVDGDGIPAHGVWLIVEGGANTDIAEAIYERKSYGCNQKGSVVVDITTASNQVFAAKFDRPNGTSLYIKFDIQKTITGQEFDVDSIKEYIIANLTYTIGEFAETSRPTEIARDAINSTSGGGVPLNLLISDDGIAWVSYLEVAELKDKWTLDAANIDITIL